MKTLKRIYQHHRDYYREQRLRYSVPTTAQVLAILIMGSLFMVFLYYGHELYHSAIIDSRTLLVMSSVFALLVFLLLFYGTKTYKHHLSIISNVVIVYVHSVIVFGTVFLMLNCWAAQQDYVHQNVDVKGWEQDDGRFKHLWAIVEYKGERSCLLVKERSLSDVEHMGSLNVELAEGFLGYAHLRTISLDEAD